LGEKDRDTMLPQKIVEPLKEYLGKAREIHNLMLGDGGVRHEQE
jgi:hypothetical protein